MKKTKRALAFAAILPIVLLGSCSGEGNSNSSSGTSTNSSTTETVNDFTVNYKGTNYEEDTDGLAITVGDEDAMLNPILDDDTATANFSYASSDETVLTVSSTGKLSALKAGTATVTVTSGGDADNSISLGFTVTEATIATKGHTYATISYEEKANLLGALEKYAVDNYLTGITIFSNGSQICYNTRYVPQPKSYISGYGWGTMREGKFTSELTNALSGQPTYYNIGTTSLPNQANAMNATGSDVSSLYDYIATAYYGTRMNETADGYEWYPILATDDRPIAVSEPTLNSDGTVATPGTALSEDDPHYNLNKRWRIHLRSGVKYRSGSSNASAKAYDGTEVQLEDYLTPIKFMLTAWNAQYRGAELTTGISGFEGAAAYYGATSTNTSSDSTALWNEDLWNETMGGNIYTGTDEDGQFIEFNLLQPCTQFYAMYNLSSTLYSPLPESFIKLWGAAALGKNTTDNSAKPVDTMLSTGPFYIESWGDTLILLKKNDQYFITQDTFADGTTRSVYNIDGIAYNEQEQSSNLKNLFLTGQIDSYAPTKDDLSSTGTFNAESGDGTDMSWRKYKTLGDSNFKLNVNACTEDQWLERFGPSGTIYQHDASITSTSTWTKTYSGAATAVKPYMSNIHFLNFLSYAINRQEICESRGMTPTQDYFSDNYLIDPETGVSYNSTDAHKAVLADRYPDTYGYNLTAAKSELSKAMEEVIVPMAENGQLEAGSGSQAGTANNPYLVKIDMEWMNTTDHTDYSDVFTYIKQVFTEVSKEDYGGAYKLDIQETGGSSDYNEVYNKMKRGEFDLGFGSISGNSLNPINFLEVLKSDNSSGFTLNWGPDTDVLGSGLYDDTQASKNVVTYDGKQWSFDGLWNAANTGVLLNDDGSMANVDNLSANKINSYYYNTIDETAQTITYKLSFENLINAGAKSITLSLKNSSSATRIFTISTESDTTSETYPDEMVKQSDGSYILTINSAFNTSAEDSSITAGTVTVTVNYTATLSGVDTNLSSTLTLLTYQGYVNAKSSN